MKELGWRRGTKLFFFTTETRSHGDRYPPNTVILARYLGERLLYLTSAHREAFCTPRGLLHTARPSAHREAFCTPRGVRSSVSLVLHKQIGKLFLQRPNLRPIAD